MGPETSTVFINKWKEMVPEIIKLASLEQDNHRIQSKFNDIPDSLSEGELFYINFVVWAIGLWSQSETNYIELG